MKISHLAKAIAQFGFKMPKTCKKPFYKNILVALCNKPLEKNFRYSRNETILKIGHLEKPIAHAKSIAFTKCSVWFKTFKCQKHAKNHCTRKLGLFCAEHRLKKTNINRRSGKGYTLCKMLSLGQKY